MAVKRMDDVGVVVESLDVTSAFFTELGLELEGRATIEGEWAGRVTGLRDQRVEIAMMRTPDGTVGSSFANRPACGGLREAEVETRRHHSRLVLRDQGRALNGEPASILSGGRRDASGDHPPSSPIRRSKNLRSGA